MILTHSVFGVASARPSPSARRANASVTNRHRGGQYYALGQRLPQRGGRLAAFCRAGDKEAHPTREPLLEIGSAPRAISRRDLAALVAGGVSVASVGDARAFEVRDFGTDAAATRQQLLDCIAAGGDFEEVESAIELLLPFNPVPDPVERGTLQGNWKLLWSSQTAEVTKATKNLPLPFTSMQLIGPKGGEGEPGGNLPEGRAANIIKVLGGAVTLKLSSAAVPSESEKDAVIIGPPFRLELLLGGKSIPLQAEETTESDTSSILGNQLNTFSQLYVEGSGQPGDLRVSKVTKGDPVVINSTFVHVRVL